MFTMSLFPMIFGLEVSDRKIFKALAFLLAITPTAILEPIIGYPFDDNALLWQWVVRGSLLGVGLLAWWWSRNDKTPGPLPAMYRFLIS